MCTAMILKALDGSVLAGRTMDFSYPLKPERFCRRAGSVWNSSVGKRAVKVRYSFCGIGQSEGEETGNVLLADGVNEAGLCVMALYFPGYAKYDSLVGGGRERENVAASYEVVPYLLGSCADVGQAAAAFQNMKIVGVPDPVTGIIAPLHWILADRRGACVTVEKTKSGLFVYKNLIGVLSNSPDFPWHMTNLRNFLDINTDHAEEVCWDGVELSPFGQGGKTRGLPGDFTPPSRFVRTAWLKSHTISGMDFSESLKHARCILGNVSIPYGCVITERGTVDYTQYTVYFDLERADCLLDA